MTTTIVISMRTWILLHIILLIIAIIVLNIPQLSPINQLAWWYILYLMVLTPFLIIAGITYVVLKLYVKLHRPKPSHNSA
jgi:large-conductance mechanosensitive channel